MDTVRTVGQFLDPGKHEVRIRSAKVARSERTGKKALELVLEGPRPFEGWEGLALDKNDKEGPKYDGPVGFLTATSWLTEDQYNSPTPAKNAILNIMMYIADSTGMRKQMDEAVEGAATIEEFVERVAKVMANTYFWMLLTGKEEEYQGKVRVKLNFFPSRSVSLKKENLEDFSMDNPYHYRKLKKAEKVSEFAAPSGGEFDLPND
jgi:hypothetical protein